MKSLLMFLTLACSAPPAWAQFADQEAESSNKMSASDQRWGGSIYSLAAVESDKAQDQGGRISTYNYFTLSTALPNKFGFGLRLPFTYGTPGTDRFNGDKNNKAELAIQDVILSVRNSELAMLPWDLDLYWEARAYLPTSKFSQQSGQITRVRNQFAVSKIFSRWLELDYDQKLSYYHQSRSTYPVHFEDENGFPVDTSGLTKRFEAEHRLDLWLKRSARVGFGWEVGVDDTYWNKSKAENKSKPGERLVFMGPAARFPITDSVNFILTYQDKVNREKNSKDFGKFKAENSEVILHTFASVF